MGFQGPPTPVRQRPCGFDEGRSLAMKLIVKSLASQCLTELDRFKVGDKNQFFRSNFSTHGDSILGHQFGRPIWDTHQDHQPIFLAVFGI